MATILNIETAVTSASIAITVNGQVACQDGTDQPKDQAAWIQPAIANLLSACRMTWKYIDAIAVTAGPGSYTGLRIGMATAKGLCFALGLPLITIDTLKVMAFAARASQESKNEWFVPMIDARRMEVFCAIYNQALDSLQKPAPVILEPDSFLTELNENILIFSGNGNVKWQNICHHPNARFVSVLHHAGHLGQLAEIEFSNRNFANLTYSEPVYLKEFHTYHNN